MTNIAANPTELERNAALWGTKAKAYLYHAFTGQPEGFDYWAEQARLTAIYAGTCARLAEQARFYAYCQEALDGPERPWCEWGQHEALTLEKSGLCAACEATTAICERCDTRCNLSEVEYVESKKAVHIYCSNCIGGDDE